MRRWAVLALVSGLGCAAVLFEPTRPDASPFAGLEVAHRGGSPENTVAAIEGAAAAGATAVEVDVLLTADGVLVAFHDETLERLTGVPGELEDLTFDELQALNVRGERMPSIEEVVRTVVRLDLKLELELKWAAHDHGVMVAEVARLFDGHDLYDRVWVASFDPTLVWRVGNADERIVTALAVGSLGSGWPWLDRTVSTAWLGRFLGVGMVELPHRWVDRRTADRWRSRGVVVNAWTANTPIDKQRLRGLGVTFTTDTPGEHW